MRDDRDEDERQGQGKSKQWILLIVTKYFTVWQRKGRNHVDTNAM
jgi:hypothetical protein